MYGRVTPDEFVRIEGPLPIPMRIDTHLEALGGGGWGGFCFKTRLMKVVGYDVDHPTNNDDRSAAYNRVGAALNHLAAKATADRLCVALGIAPIPIGENPKWFAVKQRIQTLFGPIYSEDE